jgi:ABC-2 type transport system ATP-binding protein
MVEVKSLVKHYGATRAVDGVSFSVNRGDILGFLGPNGAGKSTTMKMITGFLPPTSGTAVVDGHDVCVAPLEVKRRIGYLPESSPSYQEMTVEEFLDFVGEVRGYRPAAARLKRVEEILDLCRLREVRRQMIETLSKGYRQRVGFAQAIFHDPPVLVLDEPTDGLDPNQKHEVRRIIADMAANKAIILSTHILEEVDAICNRVIIIARGAVLVDETPKELRARGNTGRLDDVFRKITTR